MDVLVLLAFVGVVGLLVQYEQRRKPRPALLQWKISRGHSRSYQNGALLHERLFDAKSSLRKYYP